MNLEKADQYRDRAHRLMKWIDHHFNLLREAELQLVLDSVQRETFVILALLQSFSDAARVAIKRFGYRVDEFDNLIESDELLKYINRARNSEIHTDVVKLKKAGYSRQYSVVDSNKLEQMVGGSKEEHLQKAMKTAIGASSLEEISESQLESKLLNEYGIALGETQEHFMFINFEYENRGKSEIIEAPSKHLGQTIIPQVSECIRLARNFYADQLQELQQELKHRSDITFKP